MWISKDESDIVSNVLRPKLKKTREAHEKLLDEAITLQVIFCQMCLAYIGVKLTWQHINMSWHASRWKSIIEFIQLYNKSVHVHVSIPPDVTLLHQNRNSQLSYGLSGNT